MTKYKPEILETYATRLYRRASLSIVIYALAGIAIGALIGAGLATFSERGSLESTMLICAFFGFAIGFLVGDSRAFMLKLEAQKTLCQLETEKNTRRYSQATAAR